MLVMTWEIVMNIRNAAQELERIIVHMQSVLLRMVNSVVNLKSVWTAIKDMFKYAHGHGVHGKMNTVKENTATS